MIYYCEQPDKICGFMSDDERCLQHGELNCDYRTPEPEQADPLTRTRKALSLALKTIEDLQGHTVTLDDVKGLLNEVNKIERG